MIDFQRLRETMVESQIRPNEVTDPRLLAALRAMPRELFVPAGRRGIAYMDGAIEVFPAIDGAPARYLLAPMVLARLIQLASVEEGDRVLDIGCGTGYATALLARLASHVTALEAEPELAHAARRNLRDLGITNAEIVEGPLQQGWQPAGPYDVILLNGSVPRVPDAVLSQLKDGGRLVSVIANGRGIASQGKAWLFVKADGETSGLPHFDAGAAPLPGFALTPSFAF